MIKALETKNSMLFCSKAVSGWFLPRPGHAHAVSAKEVADADSFTQYKAVNQFNDKAVCHYKISGTVCPNWSVDGALNMTSKPWQSSQGYWTYECNDIVYSFDQHNYAAFAVDGYERNARGKWYYDPRSDNALYYKHDVVVRISEICHVVLSWESRHYLNRSAPAWYENYSATTFYFNNKEYAEYPTYTQAWNYRAYCTCPSGETDYWTWPNVTPIATAWFEVALERARAQFAHTEVRAGKSFNKYDTDKALMLRPLNVSTLLKLGSIAANAKMTLDRLAGADILTHSAAEDDVAIQIAERSKRFKSNALALVTDLPKFGDEIKELRELGRILRSSLSVKQGFKALAKSIPSLYLGYLYGTRLTVADLGELGDAISKAMTSFRECGTAVSYGKKSYKGTYGTLPYNCLISKKVYYNPVDTGLRSLACANYQWDVFTLENAWDLVPFSFVVDWFVNVSSVLNAVDNAGYLSYLQILSTIGSEKYSFQKDIHLTVKDSPEEDAYTLRLTLNASKYVRDLSSVSTPTFSIQDSSGVLQHIPEGTSIVSQLFT